MLKNLKSQYHQEERFVSPNLWDRLEQKLDDEKVEAPNKTKLNFRLLWWSVAAVIILVLSIFIVDSNNDFENISPKIVNQNKVETQQKEKDSRLKNPEKVENKLVEDQLNIQVENLVQIQNKPIKSEEKPIVSYDDNSIKPIVIPEEKVLAEAAKTQPTKPEKYVTSKDLLFGVELEKTRSDQQNNQKSKMGMNNLKHKKSNEDFDNRLSPKSIKILGFTIFDKDSVTKK